jgi:hypothetical protein
MMCNFKFGMCAAVVAGGFVLLGAGDARAVDGDGRRVDAVAAEGNVSPAVQVEVCGNSVGVLDGAGRGSCRGPQRADARRGARGHGRGRDDDGASIISATGARGNAAPTVQASVCGNSVAVRDGSSRAECGSDGHVGSSPGAFPGGATEDVPSARGDGTAGDPPSASPAAARPPDLVLGEHLGRDQTSGSARPQLRSTSGAPLPGTGSAPWDSVAFTALLIATGAMLANAVRRS